MAALQGQQLAEVARILAARPELARGKAPNGMPFFQLACYFANPQIIGAFTQHMGELDLFEATVCGDLPTVERRLAALPSLLNAYAPDGFPALGLACYFGQARVANFLIDQGADLEQVSRNPMQVRPIHAAVARRQYEIVEKLLQKGADVNAKQSQGYTALHAAVKQGNLPLVELLLRFGADKQARTDAGELPADLAPAGFVWG